MTNLNDFPKTEVIKTLRDTDNQVRRYAAQAIEKFPDKQAVDPLIEILKSDADKDTKQAAANALDVHAQKDLAKGLAGRLITILTSGEINEPNDRLQIVQLLKKEALQKQVRESPKELNLEYQLFQYLNNTEDNELVKTELSILLKALE